MEVLESIKLMESASAKDLQQVKSFKQLLKELGLCFDTGNLSNAKKELVGLVDKGSLDRATSGKSLLRVMVSRGILGQRKLSLLRRIASEAGITQAITLIDEYSNTRRQLSMTDNVDNDDFQVFDEMKERYLASIQSRDTERISIKSRIEECEKEATGLNKEIQNARESILKLKVTLEVKKAEAQSVIEEERVLHQLLGREEKERELMKHNIDGKVMKIKALEAQNHASVGRLNVFDVTMNKQRVDVLQREIVGQEKEEKAKYEDIKFLREKKEHVRELREKKTMRVTKVKEDLIRDMDNVVDLESKYIEALARLAGLEDLLHEENKQIIELELDLKEMEIKFKLRKSELKNSLKKNWSILQGNINISRRVIDCSSPVTDIPSVPINGRRMPRIPAYKDLSAKDSYTLSVLQYNSATFTLNRPTAVCCYQDRLFILDQSKLYVSSPYGSLLQLPIDLRTFCPVDCAITSNGSPIVISNSLIRALTIAGKQRWQALPAIMGQENVPFLVSIAVDSGNSIFILDATNQRVQHFSPDGQFLNFVWGITDLYNPCRIHATTTHLTITDCFTNCVNIFSLEANTARQKSFGGYGIFHQNFSMPGGIALDSRNNLLIADSDNHRIQVFDDDGKHVASVGMFGYGDGYCNLPVDVTVHPAGFLCVADYRNNRVVIWK